MTPIYPPSLRTEHSASLFPKACAVIPAGVNSTARARFSGWEPYPLFIDHGTGAHLFDVDGNRYIDYLLGLGPMLLGHRPPRVTAAVVQAITERGTIFALPTADEARLAHNDAKLLFQLADQCFLGPLARARTEK